MKSRKITKLFAVVLAAAMAVTSVPQTALTVFAATEDDAGNEQEPPAEKYQTSLSDITVEDTSCVI